MLWVMAAKNSYVSSRWMTYKQAQELGGQVLKGQTSSTVVKYGTFTRENDLGVEEELPYARAYRVFNADQIEGLPEDYYIRPEAPDLPPEAPSFIMRVCGFGFHILHRHFGQARRVRSPQFAQAHGALQRVFGFRVMSAV